MSNEQKYYSLTIRWNDNDTEEGEYGWSGWASSSDEAELFARQEMYADSDARKEGDPEEGIEDRGSVADLYVGANIYSAPQAADMIEELLNTDLSVFDEGYTHDKLREIMELLRPGYTEMNRNSPTAEIEPPVAPRP